MKFVTYKNDRGEELVGVVSVGGDKVFALSDLGKPYSRMEELIADYTDEMANQLSDAMAGKKGTPLEAIRLQAPIPHPRHNIICIGENYVAHAIESATYKGKKWVKPDYPIYFSKRVDRAVGPDGVIPAHADVTSMLDYEVELALVIGRPCANIKPEQAFDYIFGYTIVNDVSARDIQMNHSQWMRGKSLDGFAPMGPWIVTRNEFASPPLLKIESRVNGEVRQNSNTGDFIFDIPLLVSQLSAGITLEPGDLISTGTPSGVGMGFTPPKYLKSGDVVECRIEGIGVLRNTVG